MRIKYTYNTYTGSIPEIIKHFGLNITRQTVHNSLYRGKGLEEILDSADYTYKGVTGTLDDIIRCFYLDVDVKLVEDRLKKVCL